MRKCSLAIRGRRKSARRPWPVFGATAIAAATAFVSLAAPAAPVGPNTASLAGLKNAVAQLQGKQSGNGVATLKPLAAKLPKLADYIAWFLASAQSEAASYAEVPATLTPVWAQLPPSYL